MSQKSIRAPLKASEGDRSKIVDINGKSLETEMPTIQAMNKIILVLCAQYEQMGQQLRHLGECYSVLASEYWEEKVEAQKVGTHLTPIRVNGKELDVTQGFLTYLDIVGLSLVDDSESRPTVTWSCGARGGSLLPGHQLEIKGNLVWNFDVVDTCQA